MRLLLLTYLLCSLGCLSAQSYQSRIHYKVEIGDTSQLHQLILLDYTKLLGTIMEVADDSLRFQLRSSGEVSVIPTRELRYLGIFEASDTKGPGIKANSGPPGFTDMTYERTALPLHGKGQVRVVNLIYSVAEWNLNKNIQLGAGIGGPLGVLLTQKLRHSITPDFHIGITGQELWVPLVGSFNRRLVLLGDISAVVTLGNERRFANLGTGIIFNTDDRGTPLLAHRFGIGGQVGAKWHIYGEFLMTNPSGRFSDLTFFPGLSASLGNRRHRWKFGIFTVFFDEDSFFPPPLPFVGYSYYW
jgi:hypothetical protein